MTPPIADLRRAQDLFWNLIRAPEGVRTGLEELVRRGRAAPGDLDALIEGTDRMSPADRLDIYANMYFFRLLDCLKEDYPRLSQALGQARFHNLATDYLLAHPSGNPSLRFLGARLPGFLAEHALGCARPCLADLARLEWARADLFDAADARPLTREDLAALTEEEAGAVRLRLVPAGTLLRLGHDAPRLWRAIGERAGAAAGGSACVHQAAEEEAPPLPDLRPRRTAVRVWRKGFVVYHKSIEPDEADGLDLIASGEPLERLGQRLAAGRSASQATERLGRLLQDWIDDGILAAPAA